MTNPAAVSDDDPTPADLLIRLLKLASFISSPMRDGVCDPIGVSTTEMRVLMALAGEGALAGHDLVEITGLPAMNLSRAIASLRERGWIEDAHDPENRRRRPVTLSEAGREAYARSEPYVETVAQSLLGKLNQRQKRQLAQLSDLVNQQLVDWISDPQHAGNAETFRLQAARSNRAA